MVLANSRQNAIKIEIENLVSVSLALSEGKTLKNHIQIDRYIRKLTRISYAKLYSFSLCSSMAKPANSPMKSMLLIFFSFVFSGLRFFRLIHFSVECIILATNILFNSSTHSLHLFRSLNLILVSNVCVGFVCQCYIISHSDVSYYFDQHLDGGNSCFVTFLGINNLIGAILLCFNCCEFESDHKENFNSHRTRRRLSNAIRSRLSVRRLFLSHFYASCKTILARRKQNKTLKLTQSNA